MEKAVRRPCKETRHATQTIDSNRNRAGCSRRGGFDLAQTQLHATRETLVDVGPVNVTADTKKSIPLSPILGGVLLAGGAVLIVVGARKS